MLIPSKTVAVDAPRAIFSAECLGVGPVITRASREEEGCLCPKGHLRKHKVMSQAGLDHLIMVSPHSVMKHDMRQALLPDEETPKDFDQIFLAPPAKMSGP